LTRKSFWISKIAPNLTKLGSFLSRAEQIMQIRTFAGEEIHSQLFKLPFWIWFAAIKSCQIHFLLGISLHMKLWSITSWDLTFLVQHFIFFATFGQLVLGFFIFDPYLYDFPCINRQFLASLRVKYLK
jgi:hypothetical protein